MGTHMLILSHKVIRATLICLKFRRTCLDRPFEHTFMQERISSNFSVARIILQKAQSRGQVHLASANLDGPQSCWLSDNSFMASFLSITFFAFMGKVQLLQAWPWGRDCLGHICINNRAGQQARQSTNYCCHVTPTSQPHPFPHKYRRCDITECELSISKMQQVVETLI